MPHIVLLLAPSGKFKSAKYQRRRKLFSHFLVIFTETVVNVKVLSTVMKLLSFDRYLLKREAGRF